MRSEADMLAGWPTGWLGHFAKRSNLTRGHNDTPTPSDDERTDEFVASYGSVAPSGTGLPNATGNPNAKQ